MDSAQSKTNAIAFLSAHVAGDVERATSLCAPDYEIVTFAPIGLFPHLGQKKGGHALVAETIFKQDQRYSLRRFEVLSAIGEKDDAAVVTSMRLTKRSDGRVVEFVSAHIFKFRFGLIMLERVMFDSFALVEQLLGKDLTDEFAGPLKRAV